MPALRELYERLLEVPSPQRPHWLDRHGVDPELRRRVEAMLEDPIIGGDLLDRPAAERLAVLDVEEVAPLASAWLQRKVGAFRLSRAVGEGGMAIVFLGQREDADFDQQVAVKLLRRGLYSSFEQRLFRRERQALAALSHPNIARLIDGGITDGGVPYLAMEYVDGVPLTRWCSEHQLGLRERLGLMLTVCRAVEAAHRALIVHRDLKPSNILVAADGTPKLLDFGIAKLLDEDEPATSTGLAALTPEYAAPEQFIGGAITTATDVYALGVLLHELLVGVRPGRDATCRPSQLAGERTTDLWALPAAPLTLRRQLRGDLDNIILKALDPEPGRRYPSAGALADDLERHVAGQPVGAHPPSRWYRTRKFVTRHRGSVTLTALLVLGVLLALASALVQSRRALAATERADAVRDFIVSVFQSAQPGGPKIAPPSVVEVVERAIAEARSAPTMHPQVRTELLRELGKVLVGQGRSAQGLALLRESLQRARDELGPRATATATAELELAAALIEAGEHVEARALLDRLRAEGVEHGHDFLAQVLMRSTYLSALRDERQRGLEEADAALRECAAGCSVTTELSVRQMACIAWAQFDQDRRALDALVELLPRLRERHGPSHSEVMYALATRARAARHLDELALAEASAREAATIADAVFPALHWRRANTRKELVEALLEQRRYAEALAEAQAIDPVLLRTLGAEHPRYLQLQHTHGFVALQQGRYADGVAVLAPTLAATLALPAPPARRVALYTRDLGYARGLAGDLAAGRAQLGEAIAGFQALVPPDHDEIAVALGYLARLEHEAGALDAAEIAWDEALALHAAQRIDPERQRRLEPLTGLARVLAARGQWDAADALLAPELAALPPTSRYPEEPMIESRYLMAWIAWHRGDVARARAEAALGASELARIPDIDPRYGRFAEQVERLLAAPAAAAASP